jgi:hypothetical protein
LTKERATVTRGDENLTITCKVPSNFNRDDEPIILGYEHVDPKKFPLVWYHNETDPMFELVEGEQEIFYPVSPFDPSGNFKRF